MAEQIKDKIRISNPKAKKILKKDITKKLLKCFNEKPKTASQIANSISFPKEKIYYHIKNLISLDILFIAILYRCSNLNTKKPSIEAWFVSIAR